MSKLIVASFAACLAASSAAAATVTTSVPAYLPLETPGEGKCIVKGTFNKDDSYYTLKLGSCGDKNVATLRHVGKGKELRTSDRYCLATKSSKSDELVLRKCPAKITAKDFKWSVIGGCDQFQNGNGMCLDYDTKAKKLVQAECLEDKKDVQGSTQQWVFEQPPMIACASWGKKWTCGSGWGLDTTAGLTCVGATDSACASVCCKPVTTCKSAGYANKCPANYKFVDRQCGNAGQKACGLDVCCEYVPPKTCKSEGYERACPADYKFVNRECGNAGQKPCSRDICCEYSPVAIKCNQWNKCSKGFELKQRAADIFCVRGKPVEGPGYAPTCSNDICCDPKPVEPEYVATTCGAWNKCNPSYQLVSSPFNRQCYVPNTNSPPSTVFGMCSNDYCCLYQAPVVTTTCAQWTGQCDADAGKALVAKPSEVTGNSADVCCVQDSCKNWGARVVKQQTAVEPQQTGEQVCAAQAQTLMSKNDPRFEQPCVDPITGAKAVCKAEMCCF